MKKAQLAVLLALSFFVPAASAQWLKYKIPSAPRLADGSVNLNGPVPKNAAGRADISGLWEPAGRYVENLAKDLPANSVPMRPWAEELFKHRRDTLSKEDPTGWCVPGGVPRSDAVPYPFKIMETPGITLILYEAVHSYRQIFTDGREAPKDPNPTWMGYSTGRWDGDAFVVDTIGFNETGWLDNDGHPGTEKLHVIERFVRKDYGHMDVIITIDDSKAYTKPWMVTLPLRLVPDSELLEYVCNENNKDLEHLVGK